MSDLPDLHCTVAPLPTKESYLTPFPTQKLIAELKKRLTCNNTNCYTVPVEGSDVDATTRKLIERLDELSKQQGSINRERAAILTALAVAGVRPEGIMGKEWPGELEGRYRSNTTFANKSLREACEIILKDQLKDYRSSPMQHKSQWLSKAEIEYLIVRGGYRFATSNSKNSVGITLQRMAEEDVIEVLRVRGQQGNRYRWPSEEVKKK
jgi:hypothetical protein